MKKCSTCKIEKQTIEFNKCKTNKDGLHYVCKCCRKLERIANKDTIKKKQVMYYNDNKDIILQKNKLYRNTHCEQINNQRKQYRENNKYLIAKLNKEYLPIKKQNIKLRRQYDTNFRIKEVLRSKIHKVLKGHPTSYFILLDCDMNTFKRWIEFQFNKEMCWDNYGKVWEIDHILPINAFNMEYELDKKVCFNWTNLQPLNKNENREKYKKIHEHYYFNSIISVHRFIINEKLHKSCYQRISESLIWLRSKLRYGENAIECTMDNQQPRS
jgi:hypothetical protein